MVKVKWSPSWELANPLIHGEGKVVSKYCVGRLMECDLTWIPVVQVLGDFYLFGMV